MQSPRSSDLSCLHSISKVNVSHFNVLFCHDCRFLCQWAPYLVSPVKATCESKPIHHSQGGLTSCACSLTHSCICIVLLCTGVGRREKGVGRGARAEKGEEREGGRSIWFSFLLFRCSPVCSRYRTIPKWWGSSCCSNNCIHFPTVLPQQCSLVPVGAVRQLSALGISSAPWGTDNVFLLHGRGVEMPEEPEDQDICRDTLLPYRTRELHPKCLTVWLPNHDLNNDSTS